MAPRQAAWAPCFQGMYPTHTSQASRLIPNSGTSAHLPLLPTSGPLTPPGPTPFTLRLPGALPNRPHGRQPWRQVPR